MKTFYLLTGSYAYGLSTFVGAITEVQAEKKPRNHEHHTPRGPIIKGKTVQHIFHYYETRLDAERELKEEYKHAANVRELLLHGFDSSSSCGGCGCSCGQDSSLRVNQVVQSSVPYLRVIK